MNIEKLNIQRNKNYYANRVKIILPHLNLQGASVLDLGCGEMILLDKVKHEIKTYVGIDQYPFSDSKQFILGNICSPAILEKNSADFIFLLGVLDHLSFDEKVNLVQLTKTKFNISIVISQRNPNSIFKILYKKSSPIVNIENDYGNHEIIKLYLLKIPFTQIVLDLSRLNPLKKYGTEIIYIISGYPDITG